MTLISTRSSNWLQDLDAIPSCRLSAILKYFYNKGHKGNVLFRLSPNPFVKVSAAARPILREDGTLVN